MSVNIDRTRPTTSAAAARQDTRASLESLLPTLAAEAADTVVTAALGRLEPGCVIHSDRGSQYTSTQLRSRSAELGHRQSMGRTGSCFGNSAAESFWPY